MTNPLLLLVLLLNLAVLLVAILLWRRSSAGPEWIEMKARLDSLDQGLSKNLATATADMATRLERTKGDLKTEVADRLTAGFQGIQKSVETHLADGRREQTSGLGQARTELTQSLALTTTQLKQEFEGLNRKTAESLDAIRAQVDQKLMAISDQVQTKLDHNIKEGFAHFERVQEHLKAAEEQLRQVSTLGHSINDLNNLLKLPHLRGRFGEASLERLLADFLPAHMFELQAQIGPDRSRVDAVVKFPQDRYLPIDAKFPREQVLALFESNDESEIEVARTELVRVIKTEAKRIAGYIQPEHRTMDIALMYLPSETLYMEAVRSRDITEALAKLRVFPVSPNTLLMTLQTVSLSYKWYEVASRFEETRLEIAKAQTSLGHFQKQFETLGSSLEKAQQAYETASKHLKTYRNRVGALSGEGVAQLELPQPADNTSE